MFTGIIVETGTLATDPQPSGQGGVRFEVEHSRQLAESLEIGASLAVNGVCLTITAQDVRAVQDASRDAQRSVSRMELAPETLRRTTLGSLRAGDRVNLEPALAVGRTLDGHMVQGHVDTTVEVLERRDLGEHAEITFRLPEAQAQYLVEKGSVALDGVSLTVATLDADRFGVALLPHTLQVTNLGGLQPGQRVNLEADFMAKQVVRYVERYAEHYFEPYLDRLLAARGLVKED